MATTGVTFTKLAGDQEQRFGRWKVKVGQLVIGTTATYAGSGVGVVVAPEDFGLSKLHHIEISTGVQGNIVHAMWQPATSSIRMWLNVTEETTNPTATSTFQIVVYGV